MPISVRDAEQYFRGDHRTHRYGAVLAEEGLKLEIEGGIIGRLNVDVRVSQIRRRRGNGRS
jgi:hypothetical protein